DAALRMQDTVIIGFDREAMVQQIVEDNAKFFSLPLEAVGHAKEGMERASKFLSELQNFADLKRSVRDVDVKRSNESLTAEEHVKIALKIVITSVIEPENDPNLPLQKTLLNCLESGFPSALSEFLRSDQTTYRVKLLIYSAWRGLLLGTFGLRNDK